MGARSAADAARFDRYVTALIANRRPNPADVSADEAWMANLAVCLLSRRAGTAVPDPAWVAALRRLVAADAASRETPPHAR